MPDHEISISMRNFLISHIDGTGVAIIHNYKGIQDKHERHRLSLQGKSLQAALKREWVVRSGDRKYTLLTSAGHAIVCAALADWAEAIIRAERAEDGPKSVPIASAARQFALETHPFAP